MLTNLLSTAPSRSCCRSIDLHSVIGVSGVMPDTPFSFADYLPAQRFTRCVHLPKKLTTHAAVFPHKHATAAKQWLKNPHRGNYRRAVVKCLTLLPPTANQYPRQSPPHRRNRRKCLQGSRFFRIKSYGPVLALSVGNEATGERR